MPLLRTDQIKEIADHVSNGIIVFVHKNTREIRPMPKPTEDIEEWKTNFEKLEEAENSWLKIKNVPIEDELYLRKGFIDDATDNHVKKQLSNALKRKNPLRNFQQVVEGDEILNIHWNNYRKGAYQDWVANYVIDKHNY